MPDRHPILDHDRCRLGKPPLLPRGPRPTPDGILVWDLHLPAFPVNDRTPSPFAIPQADWFRAFLFFQTPENERASRLFVLINGLNETDDFTLYHHLARALVKSTSGRAACLVLPAPYHLHRYIRNDPSVPRALDLFVNPRPLDLFFSSPRLLWSMYRAQMIELGVVLALVRSGATDSEPLSRSKISLLHELQAYDRAHVSRYSSRIAAALLAFGTVLHLPRIHTLGFSLGGLAALAGFHLYPENIDGCATICSGPSLQSLNLFKLCEPEEWQNLLMSLQRDMERVLLEGAAVDTDLWNSFSLIYARTSEYGFRSFLDEFKRRLLFVIGGDDPIVRLDSLTAEAGSSGPTILNLAGVKHFVTQDQSWNAWSSLTVDGVLRAAEIATSNTLGVDSDQYSFGGSRLKPQRIQDDLAYFVKLLRASGSAIARKRDLRTSPVRSFKWMPADVRSEIEAFAARLRRLARSSILEQHNWDAILYTPPAVRFDAEVRLSVLWTQLFLLERLERRFDVLECASIRLPTTVQSPELVDLRLDRVFRDEGERERYRAAIYLRKATVLDRLRSNPDVEFRLLLPAAYVRRLLTVREARWGEPFVDRALRDRQLRYLADFMQLVPNFRVRVAGDETLACLTRSFYLSIEADKVRSGFELSRVHFDRANRGFILDPQEPEETIGPSSGRKRSAARRLSELERRHTIFERLWNAVGADTTPDTVLGWSERLVDGSAPPLPADPHAVDAG